MEWNIDHVQMSSPHRLKIPHIKYECPFDSETEVATAFDFLRTMLNLGEIFEIDTTRRVASKRRLDRATISEGNECGAQSSP